MLSATGRSYIDPSAPEIYNNNNDIQFKHASSFINKYGKLIRGPVLDLGCGDGRFTAYISKRFHVPVTGIDISEARIAFASSQYQSDYVKFHACDVVHINHLPEVYHNQYSTIVSFNALHHIPSHLHHLMFWHVHSMLKPDGVALFLIPGRSPELHDSIDEVIKSEAWKDYFADFDMTKVRTYESAGYYQTICKKSGFSVVEAETAIEEGKELDMVAMKSYLEGWLSPLAHLKDVCRHKENQQEIYDRFLQDVAEWYFAKMKKDKAAKVKPMITQHHITAFNNVAFFRRQNRNNEQAVTEKASRATVKEKPLLARL